MCKCNGVAGLLNTPIPIFFHAEFGRSAVKDAGINRENPQNWGALELHSRMGGVADPKIHTPHRRVLPVKFGSYVT